VHDFAGRENVMASLKSPVILAVEDEPLVLMMAIDVIEEAGFDALPARNADEAIAILESRDDIAIIFTDINMPGSMDGLKLAHAVRARWPPIKIIVTSARGIIDALPERCRFLPKPYIAADLSRAICELAL
jgi:two-component system, response regulator PdtaR